ncbi:DNA repair photolyase [Inmirania thermothiophila]|uniref:DNA repair photolyase n=1 Tax=Inmirania thermothiophila TaxID=1750597 RepID=A0A3N1Y7G2_9GAMM|nr:DNA repair photolyase [Inmirania thermothiophila]
MVTGGKGRGAAANPPPRYAAWQRHPWDDGWGGGPEPPPPTELRPERARGAIARNDSPDLPFDRSVNPYAGCEHGCIYCYARPTHARHGLSPGLDFETRILYKAGLAEALRRELAAPGYRCAPVALGANTDPYQPVERRLGITRAVLEVLAAHHHPVMVTTKSALVERDLDLLAPMAGRGLAQVALSLATLDADLARRLEPRAASPRRRLQAMARLAAAGVPVGVLVAPVIPALTDHEIERVLAAAREAGAAFAGYVLLRLPGEVAALFEDWLARHRPAAARHVLSQLRACRGGGLTDGRFGARMTGQGERARLIGRRFELAARRLGYGAPPSLDCSRFRPPGGRQLALFEGGSAGGAGL